MTEKSSSINDKLIKLKKFNSYETLLIETEKLLKNILNMDISLLTFRQNLDKLIAQIQNEIMGYEKIFLNFISYVESDKPFYSHALNTTILSFILCTNLKLDTAKNHKILAASLLHNIGEMNLPIFLMDIYLHRDEKPNDSARNHPLWSQRIIIKHLKLSEEIANITANHHEQLDGKGYPRGLDKSKLNLADNILITANFFMMVIEKIGFAGIESLEKNMKVILTKYENKFEDSIKQVLSHLFDISGVRTFSRYPINTSGLIAQKNTKSEYPCLIIDLSAGGAKISAPEPIPTLGILVLNFRVTGSTFVRNRECKVIWEKETSRVYEYGIEFIQPEINMIKEIEPLFYT